MKFLGTIIGAASGKLNGIVASHGQSGQYFRKLSIPTNPATAAQTVVRNAMKTLTTRWQETLTSTQRTAWTTYANNISWKNTLGADMKLGALPCYLRSNTPRVQSSLTTIDNAPTQFDLGTFTMPTATASHSATATIVTVATSDGWATETGSSMLVFVSRPQAASINYFKGPYQLAGKINGNTTPINATNSLSLPFPAGIAGTKLFYKVSVTRNDGRLSSDATFPVSAS